MYALVKSACLMTSNTSRVFEPTCTLIRKLAWTAAVKWVVNLQQIDSSERLSAWHFRRGRESWISRTALVGGLVVLPLPGGPVSHSVVQRLPCRGLESRRPASNRLSHCTSTPHHLAVSLSRGANNFVPRISFFHKNASYQKGLQVPSSLQFLLLGA